MRHIPNFITGLNLVAGFIAIILAAEGDLGSASWLILAAMIFDFLDGFFARLLGAYSETGKEFDSLADIVSFGIAPAMIIYKLIHSSLYNLFPDPAGSRTAIAGIISLIPAIMPVCAGLRLAKFNIDTTQTTIFRGLPTPANAIAVISLVIAASYTDVSFLQSFTGAPIPLAVYTLILSLLMITRVPLLSLKIKSLSFSGNEGRYILAGIVVLSFIVFGLAAAPLIIPIYLLVSFISAFFWPSVSAG